MGGRSYRSFDASGCPSHELVNDNTLKIDMTDPKCIRAAKLVDHMIANETLWNTDYFDASFVKQMNDNKVLMVSMASWAWGVFNGTYYKTAEHQLGVAAPLKWTDDDKAQTPAMGGGGVDRFAAHQESQAGGGPGDLAHHLSRPVVDASNFPAYKPIMPLWQKKVSSNALFANDPFPVMQTAASLIDAHGQVAALRPHFPVERGGQGRVSRIRRRSNRCCRRWPKSSTPLAQAEGYEVVNK